MFYSKYEATNFKNYCKSFKYIAKLLGSTEAQPSLKNANEILKNEAIAVLLKHLSNFWRSLKLPLINCKVELKLK